jgi:hypothetical protein
MFPKAPPFSSHHCSPNFNFHIYITGRWERSIGKHDKACFHFGERFYVWECPIFENIGDGKSNDSFWKKRRRKETNCAPLANFVEV